MHYKLQYALHIIFILQCIKITNFHVSYKMYGGIINMAFKLKPDKKESENQTIRFPVDLIDEINTAIAKKEVSFSGFVIQACQYALNELEDSDEDNSQNSKK